MISALDSATPPSLGAVLAAKAAGIKLWNGYIESHPKVNLYQPWTPQQFDVARQTGNPPIAYCSGLDDPAALRQMAVAWGVRLCLDVEGGIRPDGSWVQPWLDVSGAGLYGTYGVHAGRRAAFHILAWYPGYDPHATWSGAKPATPCGWQWQNSHNEFGVTVDRCWFDDGFIGGNKPMPTLPATWRSVALGGDWKQITELTEGIDKNGNRVLRAVGVGNDNQAYLIETNIADLA